MWGTRLGVREGETAAIGGGRRRGAVVDFGARRASTGGAGERGKTGGRASSPPRGAPGAVDRWRAAAERWRGGEPELERQWRLGARVLSGVAAVAWGKGPRVWAAFIGRPWSAWACGPEAEAARRSGSSSDPSSSPVWARGRRRPRQVGPSCQRQRERAEKERGAGWGEEVGRARGFGWNGKEAGRGRADGPGKADGPCAGEMEKEGEGPRLGCQGKRKKGRGGRWPAGLGPKEKRGRGKKKEEKQML
jgi:hypothetical protein